MKFSHRARRKSEGLAFLRATPLGDFLVLTKFLESFANSERHRSQLPRLGRQNLRPSRDTTLARDYRLLVALASIRCAGPRSTSHQRRSIAMPSNTAPQARNLAGSE